MNIQTPLPKGHQTWEQVRGKLDQNAPFSNMYDTPYYRDAVPARLDLGSATRSGLWSPAPLRH